MNSQKRKENLLFIAWCVSFISTLGSLYFSEIMKFIPCTLCWYQRIFMYPLVLLLGVAVIKKDYSISRYSLIFGIIGSCFSLYHYLIQKIVFFSERAVSCGRVPCTGEYINWLGFITIPFLALIGFITISICSLILLRISKEYY
ncbi:MULTISPECIES: disulfide formation protein C [Bacillus]|uniref:disulfide formation protein C n=1 Tax=Bacillus TaxID=1386 RepID=UPI0012621B6F|nr:MULTISPECIES: disulfide oxidoreductase [Bacillus]KAB7650285.1 disulfide bond formation protein B [Bacillus sp. B2-WWTP-C-10-Post-4]MDC7777929.1 disulfide oxidoreductase [Bacillus cereus]MDK3015859.1 disulfide oxidoreductase [Bacillus sp. RB3]